MKSTSIFAVCGLVAALVGSWSVDAAPWASRVMLIANLLVLFNDRGRARPCAVCPHCGKHL